MDRTYWQKQTSDQPLFPDLLWSRPENKKQAGKLLIVGGNAQSFAAPAEAFAAAQGAGVGSTRVILPDSLQKTVSKLFPEAEFAPSTPSGSFARQALAEIIEHTQWADGVLLAGDFGRNSETAILLEELLNKYTGQLASTQDAIDYFINTPGNLLNRDKTLLVPTFAQLQKFASQAGFKTAFTSDMDLLRLVEALHEFSKEHMPAALVLAHHGNTFVAVDGRVSTTKQTGSNEAATAAGAAVWWLQNKSKIFEALTSSLI